MAARLTEVRLPTDCWAVLHEFLREVHAVDPNVAIRLWQVVPAQQVLYLNDSEVLVTTRQFIREGAADSSSIGDLLQAVWIWAENHRLVRSLSFLQERSPWTDIECYHLYNYSRSLVNMAVQLLRVRERTGPNCQSFPPFAEIVDSALRHDPFEMEEYLALAATARHLSAEDRKLIAALLRDRTGRPPGNADIEALLLAGAVPIGDEHSFAAIARYQVGLRSADKIAQELAVSRQVADRWIRGAARLLVGPVFATAWLRDPIPAGRPRNEAGR